MKREETKLMCLQPNPLGHVFNSRAFDYDGVAAAFIHVIFRMLTKIEFDDHRWRVPHHGDALRAFARLSRQSHR